MVSLGQCEEQWGHWSSHCCNSTQDAPVQLSLSHCLPTMDQFQPRQTHSGLRPADLSSWNQVRLPLSIHWVTISLFCHLFPLETIIYHYIPLQNIGWNSYYFLPQLTSCNQMVFLDFLPAQSEHYSRVSSISRHSLTLLILDWTIISQISMEIFSCIYETNPGEIPSFLFPQFSAQYSLSVDLQTQISKIKREGSKIFTQQWLLSLVATGYFVCSEVVGLSVLWEEKQ